MPGCSPSCSDADGGKAADVLDLHLHLIDRLAFVNGLISGIALFPQLVKVLAFQDAGGISVTSIALIFLNSLVWVFYALHRGLVSVGVAALLNTFASGALFLALLAH